MILLFDNYDSFTYNLLDYLKQLKANVLVIRNDEKSLEEITQLNVEGIVISPGPETPSKAGILPELIKYYYNKVPILGICLGHQAIGEYFGARLVKADKPMHGKVSVVMHNNHIMFSHIPLYFEAMRYHSLQLINLPKELNCTAETEQKEVMAFAHFTLPIWGIQFHPESVLTPHGLQMIKNWYDLVYPSDKN